MKNREGINVAVTYYHIPPFTSVTKDGFKLGPSLMKSLLDYLTEAINLNITVVLPEEPEYGKLNKTTGSWSGIIGVISRKQADIGMLPFGLSYQRHAAMSFTTPFYYSYGSILSKEPESQEDAFAFLKTLESEVWYLLILVLIVTSYIYVILDKYDLLKNSKSKSFYYYFWQFYSAICNQSMNFDSNQLSESIFISFWWYFRIILLTTYSGTLIASFSYRENEMLDTLTQLLQRKNLKTYVLKNSIFQDYFQNSPLAEAQEVYKKIEKLNSNLPNPLLQSPETYMEIINGKAAMVHEVLSINRITAAHCDKKMKFYYGSKPLFWLPLAIGIRKDLDPYLTEKLNQWLTLYTNMQLLSPHVLKMRKDALSCVWEKPESTPVKPMTIKELRGVFTLLLGGISISLIIFFCEIFLYSKHVQTSIPSLGTLLKIRCRIKECNKQNQHAIFYDRYVATKVN